MHVHTDFRTSSALRFLWLEITGKCQLACEHCYAESGPKGTNGVMTVEDWQRVIDEASRESAVHRWRANTAPQLGRAHHLRSRD